MSLIDDLPLLDGWKYNITEQGAAKGQSPQPLQAERPLLATTEGRGFLLYALAVSNDPHLILTITADGKELVFNASELAFGGLTGNVPGGISVPMAGKPYGPLGQAFTVVYQGLNAPLAYRENVNVTVRSSTYVSSPQLISWLIVLVQIYDPTAFRASYRALHAYPPASTSSPPTTPEFPF